MNELIVWDKDNYFGEDNQFHELDKFLDEGLSVEYKKDDGLVVIDYDRDELPPKVLRLEAFDYIKKTDMEGNKIYAECSIVEFEVTINSERQMAYTRTLKGSFEFNDEDLRYEINIYGESDYICVWYDCINMRNFKIIDTIQENKLGLIKK